MGGLVFSSCAKSVKYAFASMAPTWSRVDVFMSTAGSTVPATGVYGLPYDDSGTAVI